MENALKITISIFHFIKLQFYRLFEQLQNVRSPPSSQLSIPWFSVKRAVDTIHAAERLDKGTSKTSVRNKLFVGENKKNLTSARKKHVLSSYDRFYPLQSHDRECISSSAMKHGTAGKLRTLPVQSIFVLRIRRFLRDRSSSPVERLRPTPMCDVKEKTASTAGKHFYAIS